MQTGTRREFALGNPKNRSFASNCRTQTGLQTSCNTQICKHPELSRLGNPARSPFTNVLRFLSRKVLENFLLRENLRASGTEDLQKRDLEGERFLNVAAEVVPQFFQTLNPAKHFRCAKTVRQHGGFLFCRRQIAPGDFAARP